MAISKELISSEVIEFQTDCEIVWAEINIVGSNKMYIGSYYRPHASDQYSVKQLAVSLSRTQGTNATTILGGDFNTPSIDWTLPEPILKQGGTHTAIHEELLDVLNDHGLEQMVHKPTRGDNTLDLLVTNRPSSVNRIEIMPKISDHATVFADISCQPKFIKQVPRRISLFSKANWGAVQDGLLPLAKEFESMDTHTADVEALWSRFKSLVTNLTTACVPSKIARSKCSQPWITQKVRNLIKKRNKIFKKNI